MIFYEKTISLISTKYDSEESFPKDNKGTQAVCQPHPSQQVLCTLLSGESKVLGGLFTLKSVFKLFHSVYNYFAVRQFVIYHK